MILYLTNAIKEEDYDYLLNQGYLLLNPSNQNFHNKFIRALGTIDKVSVLSYVPTSTSPIQVLSSDNYHYVEHADTLFDKSSLTKRLVKEGKKLVGKEDVVILFDPLNVALGRAAIKLSSLLKVPAIPILTDYPKNLAKAPYFFQRSVLSTVDSCSNAIALSAGLLAAYKKDWHHSCVFAGIVEKNETPKQLYPKGSYFYFGGALLRRYGIYNLLDAYQSMPSAYDLVIAGHSSKDAFDAYLKNPHIHFLGQVTKEENYALEKNAALLINPRPYDPLLDEQSIPSKLLEYLASGSPIVSTLHSGLKKEFPNDISWLEHSKAEDLANFLKAHLDSTGHLQNLTPNQAADKVYELYGLEAVASKVQSFLQEVKASIN